MTEKDLSEIISPLIDWREENKEERVVIVMAVDLNNSDFNVSISGKEKILVALLASSAKCDEAFRRILFSAAVSLGETSE